MTEAIRLLRRLIKAVGDCEDTDAVLAIARDAEKLLAPYDLTPWYQSDVKPVYAGPYEVNCDKGRMQYYTHQYAYFDGKDWGSHQSSIEKACRSENATWRGGDRAFPWRGITEESHIEVTKAAWIPEKINEQHASPSLP